MWYFLIFFVIFLALFAWYYTKKYKKMVADGSVIKRRPNFMESAEEFTLVSIEPERMTESICTLEFKHSRISTKYNDERQLFKFSAVTWEATLRRLSYDDEQMTYRFQFEHWKMTGTDMPRDFMGMNELATSIEKLFVTLDPNTSVVEIPLEVKEKNTL